MNKTMTWLRTEKRATAPRGPVGTERGESQPSLSAARAAPILDLQHQIGNQATQRLVAQRDGRLPPQELERAAGRTLEQDEKRAEAFATYLKGEKPTNKSQGTKAAQKVGEALLKSKPVKKVLDRKLRDKAPAVIKLFELGSGAAAWLSKKTDTVTTPDIRLRKNVSMRFEYKGTAKKFKKVMVYLRVEF